MLKPLPIITTSWRVIFLGTCFQLHSECSIWPAPRVGWSWEVSFCASDLGGSGWGGSGCILCALALTNPQFLHSYRVLLIGVVNMGHYEFISCGTPDKECIYSSTPPPFHNCVTRMRFLSSLSKVDILSPSLFKTCLELHSPQQYSTSCSMFSIILLHFVIYLPLSHSHQDSPTFCLHYNKLDLCPAWWEITIHSRIKKYTLTEDTHSRKQSMFFAHLLFTVQLSPFVHYIADDDGPRLHLQIRIMILIRRFVMTKVRTPESPPEYLTL